MSRSTYLYIVVETHIDTVRFVAGFTVKSELVDFLEEHYLKEPGIFMDGIKVFRVYDGCESDQKRYSATELGL